MTFASLLAKSAKGKQIPAEVRDLGEDAFSFGEAGAGAGHAMAFDAPRHVFVFFLATYGDGEPTSNAVEFYNWLMKEATAEQVAGRHVCVFGLGNSATYPERFAVVGKAVDARLAQLGAVRVLPLALGDAAHDMDSDFSSWEERFWTAIDIPRAPAAMPTRQSAAPALSREAAPYRPSLAIVRHALKAAVLGGRSAGTGASMHWTTEAAAAPADYRSPAAVRCIANRELQSPDSPRSTRHITFDLHGGGGDRRLSYETGDHVGIYPRNASADVEQLAAWLGYADPGQVVISLAPGGSPEPQHAPFAVPRSLFDILQSFKDMRAAPTRGVLGALASFARGSDADALRVMGDRKADVTGEYERYILAECRGLFDVFGEFASLQRGAVPLAALLELMPLIQARFYSISSSALASPSALDLTVTAVRQPLGAPSQRLFRGLCSNYLAALPAGGSSFADAFVRRSQFRLPREARRPVILIGAGAGLAPLRAFVHERAAQRAAGASLGAALLFFGCNSPREDFLYRDELEAAVASGDLSGLFPAFAAEPSGAVRFVQHALAAQASVVYPLLREQGAAVFVCGKGSTVGAGVKDALVAMYDAREPGTGYAALRGMIERQQMQQDVFS